MFVCVPRPRRPLTHKHCTRTCTHHGGAHGIRSDVLSGARSVSAVPPPHAARRRSQRLCVNKCLALRPTAPDRVRPSPCPP
eukprot:2034376-Prymnesium_polylepis.1